MKYEYAPTGSIAYRQKMLQLGVNVLGIDSIIIDSDATLEATGLLRISYNGERGENIVYCWVDGNGQIRPVFILERINRGEAVEERNILVFTLSGLSGRVCDMLADGYWEGKLDKWHLDMRRLISPSRPHAALDDHEHAPMTAIVTALEYAQKEQQRTAGNEFTMNVYTIAADHAEVPMIRYFPVYDGMKQYDIDLFSGKYLLSNLHKSAVVTDLSPEDAEKVKNTIVNAAGSWQNHQDEDNYRRNVAAIVSYYQNFVKE